MPGNKVRITAETVDNASGPLDKIRDKFDKIQKQGAKGFGIGVGAAVTTKALGLMDTALSGIVDVIGDSITAASDLSETMSKADVIFGQNAKAVEKWADTAATSFGQSKKEALDTASGFAGLFKTVGLGIDQATAFSKKLTVLGSDLASFFNTDVGTALDALKSGLNGEAEPLRRFNIFLSETAVQTKLAQMGIQKVGGSFTEAQKATARYQLILDQTGDAQGDFQRTGDGLANSQRTINAEMADASAELGKALLPFMKELARITKEDVAPALKDFIGLLDSLPDVGNWWDDTTKGVQNFIDTLPKSEKGLAHQAEKAKKAAEAAALLGDKTGDATNELQPFTVATDGATGATKDLAAAIRPAYVDLRTYTERLGDATDALEDEMFATGDARRALQEHKLELKRDIDKLKELEAIKHPTRDQRLDILQTKDAIADDKKGAIEAAIKLRAMGKITYGQLIGQLDKVGINIMEDTTAAKLLRLALLQADQAMGGRAGGGGHRGGGAGGTGAHKTPPPTEHKGPRAGGGGVFGRGTYLVGEKGPELFTPESNGRITPNANTMMMRGGGGRAGDVTIHVGAMTFQGVGSDVSPATARRFGQSVLDEVARGLQEQAARNSVNGLRP